MKKVANKYVTWGVVASFILVIIAAVVYFVYATKKSSAPSDDDSEEAGASLLSYGSHGEDVKALQSFLNAKIAFFSHERDGRPVYRGETINSLVVDGIFGARTQCATKWWFNKDSVNISELN